jgi:hypothetical protein
MGIILPVFGKNALFLKIRNMSRHWPKIFLKRKTNMYTIPGG